jgi:hypothetical protein
MRGRAVTSDLQITGDTDHNLASHGSTEWGVVQLQCVMCGKKASTYCTKEGCNGVTLCQTSKRRCFIDHCEGVKPEATKKRRRSWLGEMGKLAKGTEVPI